MRPRRFPGFRLPGVPAAVVAAGLAVSAISAVASGHARSIRTEDLREWLSNLASDELQGRATYEAGLGLAAGYIQGHLRAGGVEPRGDDGSFVQTVRVHGVKVTSRSAVTVRVGRETRTFADGQGVVFPRNAGGKRTLTVDRVQFVGYGLDALAAGHSDFGDRDVRGSAVVWLGADGPRAVDPTRYRRVLSGRGRYATEQRGALASIGPDPTPAAPAQAPAGAAAAEASTAVDFTTAQRLDHLIPPSIRGSEEFYRFLFSSAIRSYDDLKRLADGREPLPSFPLDEVSLTFVIDHDYEIVRTQFTQNIVGVVEGRDPQLRSTYVAYGAHFDHVGYAQGPVGGDGRRAGAPGRVTDGAVDDVIWNGADDNGSGTAAILAVARAFAAGPRPKRSLLFVWHGGEERGLLGSRYFVDHPTVPLGSIVAHLNADMVGRNRDDRPAEANTVYLVGSDRISSELHEISREANRALEEPLTLDYEMNDPADLEQVYFRSDHYSYAARGIPVIFFTTGLHPDYHANTDHVAKIEFEKLARIACLLHETGARVADLDHQPVRDNRGPRAGKGTPW
jgi:hypothetical protein